MYSEQRAKSQIDWRLTQMDKKFDADTLRSLFILLSSLMKLLPVIFHVIITSMLFGDPGTGQLTIRQRGQVV